jgi:hypothetical protein
MKEDGSIWPVLLIAGLIAFAAFNGNRGEGVAAFFDRDLHESYGWGSHR